MQTLVRAQSYDDQFRKGFRPDKLHAALKAAQKPLTRYLWTPSDAITFTPRVSDNIYGDGRALFGIGTINSRPAYWIIRGCSSWSCGMDTTAPCSAPGIVEYIDQITFDLEEEFGRAESGETFNYEGNRLRCCETGRFLRWEDISYPVVNYGGGSHWFRLSWPKLPSIKTEPHPYSRCATIITSGKSGNE